MRWFLLYTHKRFLIKLFKDLNILVGELTTKQKSSQAIKHALEVQRALSTNNYHAFFDFYANAPNMGGYIMDHFVDRERTKALMVMAKACVLGVMMLSSWIDEGVLYIVGISKYRCRSFAMNLRLRAALKLPSFSLTIRQLHTRIQMIRTTRRTWCASRFRLSSHRLMMKSTARRNSRARFEFCRAVSSFVWHPIIAYHCFPLPFLLSHRCPAVSQHYWCVTLDAFPTVSSILVNVWFMS